MKIANGIPKVDENKHNELLESGWNKLKEPKNLSVAILSSIPLMIINGFISLFIIKLFVNISLEYFGMGNGTFSLTINLHHILGILLVLVVHEILHLIFIPNFAKSDKTYIGFSLAGGYVFTEEVICKKRYILITLIPFLVISIIAPLVLGLLGLLNVFYVFLILFNAIGSSVDMLNLIFILFQVPNDCCIVSNGTNTYWKKNF